MAPQRLEKIESAPGNGMGSEASNLLDLVHKARRYRARLRLTSREDELQKKVPNTLKSLYAELKLSLALRHPNTTARAHPRGSASRASTPPRGPPVSDG